MQGQLNWFKGGILLGLIFLLAVWLVKPIGVSTQFVIFDGIIWNIFSEEIIQEDADAASGYYSTNEYLAKSGGKYAKNAANPINYSFLFALSMILGAFISNKTKGPKPTSEDRVAPQVWRSKFGDTPWKRYLAVFCGGFLVLLGARLAGGCTSGHMMSGMMQTSISGYLFAVGAFLTAVPAAIFIYTRKEKA